MRYLEDARTRLRLRNKKSALLEVFKTFCVSYKQEHEGDGPTFNFAELLELPFVKGVLEDNDILVLPDTVFSELEVELPVIVEGRGEKLRAECIALVNDERNKLGLSPFGSTSMEGDSSVGPSFPKAPAVPITNCPLLAASTKFASYNYWSGRNISFKEVMEYFFGNPFPETAEYGRKTYTWKAPEFRQDFAKDAEDILQRLGLPFNVTSEHMDGIADSLTCKTCTYRISKTWVGWVSSLVARMLRL